MNFLKGMEPTPWASGPKSLLIELGIHHRLWGRVSKNPSIVHQNPFTGNGWVPNAMVNWRFTSRKSLLIVEALLVTPGDNDSCCCRCWYAKKAKHSEVCSHSNILVFSGRHFHKTDGGLTHVPMINSHLFCKLGEGHLAELTSPKNPPFLGNLSIEKKTIRWVVPYLLLGFLLAKASRQKGRQCQHPSFTFRLSLFFQTPNSLRIHNQLLLAQLHITNTRSSISPLHQKIKISSCLYHWTYTSKLPFIKRTVSNFLK